MFRLINRRASFQRRVIFIALILLLFCSTVSAQGRKRKIAAGGARAVVIDEHLAALRNEPRLNAPLLKRLSRGRDVFVQGVRRSIDDGVTFYRVMVTRRTGGWLQSEGVALIGKSGEDARLLNLIQASEGFERIARARIFLDNFPRSALRPKVLLLYANAAEDAAAKLTRDAARRLKEEQIAATSAPRHSYFLNFNELDRYNRQGVGFTFDRETETLHYDGAAWREILRRYPRSAEAAEAQQRLNGAKK
jgi:hypothetical protein